MRILGLDVGDVRVGIALSDPTSTIASPLSILNAKKVLVDKEIIEIIKNRDVKLIVYGLPISLDGSEKRQAEKVKDFIKKLKKSCEKENLNLNFVPMDERFSTISANNMLRDIGMNKKRKRVDNISAAIILQNYLDSLKFKKIEL